MDENVSRSVSTESVVSEIASYIVASILSAFQLVSEASDALALGAAYAKPVDGTMGYYAVQDEMETLHGELPGLVVERKPNRTKSSYHAELLYKGVTFTFASAHDEGAMPKWAGFRQDLMQSHFDIGENGAFKVSTGDSDQAYVQIVYGRSGPEVTFVKAVCVTAPNQSTVFLYPLGEQQQPDTGDLPPDDEQISERDWFSE